MKLQSTIGIILAIAISSCGLKGTEGKITSSGFPTKLSEKIDTIEITYIA